MTDPDVLGGWTRADATLFGIPLIATGALLLVLTTTIDYRIVLGAASIGWLLLLGDACFRNPPGR